MEDQLAENAGFTCEFCAHSTAWTDMPAPTHLEEAVGCITCPNCNVMNDGGEYS